MVSVLDLAALVPLWVLEILLYLRQRRVVASGQLRVKIRLPVLRTQIMFCTLRAFLQDRLAHLRWLLQDVAQVLQAVALPSGE